MYMFKECTNFARILSKELASSSDKTTGLYYFPQIKELGGFCRLLECILNVTDF